jgi:hypothetical protein
MKTDREKQELKGQVKTLYQKNSQLVVQENELMKTCYFAKLQHLIGMVG